MPNNLLRRQNEDCERVVESSRNCSRNNEFKHHNKRQSCSGNRVRAECDSERHNGHKDRRLISCCRSGERCFNDCPYRREKSAETCTCKKSTSVRPKSDHRTFSGRVIIHDRRPKTVGAEASISKCRSCCRSFDDLKEESLSPRTKCTSKKMYKNLGGGLNCRRCGRKVYHAEMQLVSGEAYHRICFSCFCCRKPLDPFTFEEHCREIFCKQCYTRNFGPQGYGYGMGAGALQTPL